MGTEPCCIGDFIDEPDILENRISASSLQAVSRNEWEAAISSRAGTPPIIDYELN